MLPAPSPTPRGESLTRRDLRYVSIAWVFGSFWLWTINGAALTQFARALGTPDPAFGLIASMIHIGALAQLPAVFLLARLGGRKRFFMVTAVLSRLAWPAMAAIPWLMRDEAWAPYRWLAMLVALLIAWSLHHLSVPAWMAWMGDVIPRRIRGRYFARRRLFGLPGALLATLSVGYLLDLVTLDAHHGGPSLLLIVTSLILALAGTVGAMDILLFRPIPEVDPPPKQPRPDLRRLFLRPLRDRGFLIYLGYTFFFTMSIGYVGQYIWLYLFDVVGATNAQANMMLLAVPVVVNAIMMGPWGRLIDRFGDRSVLIVSTGLTVCGAVLWLIVPPGRPWVGLVPSILMNMCWPGLELATMNIMIAMASRRDHHGDGTGYLAVNNVVVALAGVLAGVLANVLAVAFRDWSVPMPGPMAPLTYHAVLFGVSALLRFAALLFALALPVTERRDTRDLLRHMTMTLYGNAKQVALAPTRIVGVAYRLRRRA